MIPDPLFAQDLIVAAPEAEVGGWYPNKDGRRLLSVSKIIGWTVVEAGSVQCESSTSTSISLCEERQEADGSRR